MGTGRRCRIPPRRDHRARHQRRVPRRRSAGDRAGPRRARRRKRGERTPRLPHSFSSAPATSWSAERTTGLANVAAARKVTLTEVRSTVTGDIDLNGVGGLDPRVRNGYQKINVRFTVKGDAPAEVLRELVEQSRSRSAVYDEITNGVPVTVDVDVA